MGKRNKDETEVATSAFENVIINEDHLETLNDILKQKEELQAKKATKEAEIKEAIAALAEELNVKPADINKVLQTMAKESNTRGHINKENSILDVAKQALEH